MIVSKTYLKHELSNSKINIEIKYSQNGKAIELVSSAFKKSIWEGIDLLDAFNKMRTHLEENGYLIFVNGARKNSWASGFLRDSSNGLLTYIFSSESKEVVNIFDLCEIDVVKYSEQCEFYNELRKKWRNTTK